MIGQAVDWPSLNRITTEFLLTFIIHLIVSTQTASPLFVLPRTHEPNTIDDEAIQEVFNKALSNLELARGWSVLLRGLMQGNKAERVMDALGMSERDREVIVKGLEAAEAILMRPV